MSSNHKWKLAHSSGHNAVNSKQNQVGLNFYISLTATATKVPLNQVFAWMRLTWVKLLNHRCLSRSMLWYTITCFGGYTITYLESTGTQQGDPKDSLKMCTDLIWQCWVIPRWPCVVDRSLKSITNELITSSYLTLHITTLHRSIRRKLDDGTPYYMLQYIIQLSAWHRASNTVHGLLEVMSHWTSHTWFNLK